MSVGLEALRIFQAVATLDMRDKYPLIYRNDIDSSCKFSPNNRYTYSVTSKKIIQISPLFCFTLIPEKTIAGESALTASFYLLHFLNWAIYFYKDIYNDYNNLPVNRPKKSEWLEVQSQTQVYADMIESITGKQYSEDDLEEKTNRAFKKNNFILKPNYFLKLCRFFARGWYEEWFCTEESAVGSVEFAYYISNYIKSSLVTGNKYDCKRYNGNSKNSKNSKNSSNNNSNNSNKEVSKLFQNDTKIEHTYNNFHILLEKHSNQEKDPSYSISIDQQCKHVFYLYSRLYIHRYTSPIK
jgi:hypothetical protein